MADTANPGQHPYVRSLYPDGQDSLAKIARREQSRSRVLDLETGPGVWGRYLAKSLTCQLDGVEDNSRAANWRPHIIGWKLPIWNRFHRPA